MLLKGVSQTIQNEAKEQKRGFLSMLLAGKRMNRAGEGFLRAGFES